MISIIIPNKIENILILKTSFNQLKYILSPWMTLIYWKSFLSAIIISNHERKLITNPNQYNTILRTHQSLHDHIQSSISSREILDSLNTP